MFRQVLLFLLTIQVFSAISQENNEKQSLSIVFMGDIMGHDAQIKSAYNAKIGTYDYTGVFEKVKPLIEKADFAVANLEVTLAGRPFKGYPQFSSPDALAVAAKQAGIDVLVTANNHSCDRGKQGILRTLRVLDSLKILHTGTFKDSTNRAENNLLILSKNEIHVGLLNYTYGTNGIVASPPTIVNMLDTAQMAKDIIAAQAKNLDKLIVVLHWGIEYKRHPNKKQEQLAAFLFEKGVDVIIGSHPHVVQRLEYRAATATAKEQFIAYSLGNFVSNQRAKTKDGGIMAALTFTKNKVGEVSLSDKGYYLTWVHRPKKQGQYFFEILPCTDIEKQNFIGIDSISQTKMKYFIKDTRKLFDQVNVSVPELKY